MLLILAKVNEQAEPNWVLLIGAAVTIVMGLVGAIFGFIEHRGNKKVEKKKNASDHSIQLLDQLALRVGTLETKVTTLEQQKEDLSREKSKLNQIINDLRGHVKDYEELIKDFVTYTEAIIHWYESGSGGPFPNRTWRINEALTRRYSTKTTKPQVSKEDEDA